MILILIPLLILVVNSNAGSRCHFTVGSKIYFIKPLQRVDYYSISEGDYVYYFNFCSTVHFNSDINCNQTYSMAFNVNTLTCIPLSSDSLLHSFDIQAYYGQKGQGIVITEISGIINNQTGNMYGTKIIIICGDNENFQIDRIDINENNDLLQIIGISKYGCPILVVSSLWSALSDNLIIFGLILFFVGLMQLFFGRKMVNPTLFIACYCVSFSVIGAFTSQVLTSANSSFIWVYFCLLITIIGSSFIAYTMVGLAHISIFFIGAWMGLIVSILINTIFINLTGIYTVWSLILFAIIFCLGLGLLTFRYYDQILILSTCITGSYMIIRPFSWIFGGYPNQFLLADQIKSGDISMLQGTFFIYLIFMLLLTILGGMYQFLQLRREKQQSLQIGFVEQKIQYTVDTVKNTVNAIINKYRVPEQDNKNQYVEFQTMKLRSSKFNLQNDDNQFKRNQKEQKNIFINQNQLKQIKRLSSKNSQ